MLENYKTNGIILNSGTERNKRQEIKEYFNKTFELDEKLYETLASDESFYLRADPLRHPLVFYFGHTATFFINKLILAKIINERINPKFESIFAIGVDEMSWDDLNENNYDWPTIPEIRKYRTDVKKLINELIDDLPLEIPIEWNDPFWVIMMGIEHERIHLETSSVLIRELPISAVREHELFPICENSGEAPQNELINIDSGKIKLGKDFSNIRNYGWDNEFGILKRNVEQFKATKFLVSNKEYYDFINDNGYKNEKYWTEEGWKWVQYKKAEFPVFWINKSDGFYLRTMTREIKIPWNWPAEVNFLEAKAFCNWKSEVTGKPIRLPSEEEWHLLRDQEMNTDLCDWGQAPGNINLEYYASSCSVDQFKFKQLYDVVGNVWQWTETPIYGFDGFKVHPFYDDFSTPTFDTRHNIFKGGSWISTGNEATKDARYAFRRHFFQHAGFRYVESENPVELHDTIYEEDESVTPYCERDYGKDLLGLGNFSEQLAEFSTKINKDFSKVLNIGCKTGRSTFELAKFYNEITGIDFTARLIQVGTKFKETGKLLYTAKSEGEIIRFEEKNLSDFGLENLTKKVEFYQADPSNLLEKFSGFDLIVVENILEETYNPKKFLGMINQRLNEEGYLILASSFDWQNEIRLGGFREDGEPVWSKEVIANILSKNFVKVDLETNIPHYLPNNDRSFSVKISEVSVWKKK